MVYLFTIPLLLGALPQLIFWLRPTLDAGSAWQNTIQTFAIATLVAGSALQGVVEIYGTTNHYVVYYFGIGLAFLLLSMVLYLKQFRHNHDHGDYHDAKPDSILPGF